MGVIWTFFNGKLIQQFSKVQQKIPKNKNHTTWTFPNSHYRHVSYDMLEQTINRSKNLTILPSLYIHHTLYAKNNECPSRTSKFIPWARSEDKLKTQNSIHTFIYSFACRIDFIHIDGSMSILCTGRSQSQKIPKICSHTHTHQKIGI